MWVETKGRSSGAQANPLLLLLDVWCVCMCTLMIHPAVPNHHHQGLLVGLCGLCAVLHTISTGMHLLLPLPWEPLLQCQGGCMHLSLLLPLQQLVTVCVVCVWRATFVA